MLEILQQVQLSTWVTAGAAGFVAFLAGLAFSRGALKQLVGMVSLGIGVSVAWYVFRHRTEVFGSLGTSMNTDRLLLFSLGAGVLAYTLCKVAVHLLAALGLLKLFGGLAGWKGVMLSAIPSGCILWVASMGLRLVGNLYGLETASAVAREGSKIQSHMTSVWDQLSRTMDRSFLGSVASRVDPFSMRATSNLARLLILWPDGTIWAKLAQSPETRDMLYHPRLQKLGLDAAVRQCIERKDFAGLMQLPQVEETARLPELQPLLSGLELEEAMDSIIYGKPTRRRS